MKSLLLKGAFIIMAQTTFMANGEDLYEKYQPQTTSRVIENIEWSITYAYNAKDTKSPRVLLLGDSICNAYHSGVRKNLEKTANVSFWATSKCVTDKDFFRELDFILSSYPYTLIFFNNTIHSLTSDQTEWQNALAQATRFIREKCPTANLILVNGTPAKKEVDSDKIKNLNQIMAQIASDENLQLLDLFASMDPLDRTTNWRDNWHFGESAINIQADLISNLAKENLQSLALDNSNITQKSSDTGPDGKLN